MPDLPSSDAARDVPVLWLGSVASTQDAAAAHEAAPPFAVATLDQHGGRGRLGRTWLAPPGSGLSLTVAVRTALPPQHRTWIPLVAGLAALDALEELAPGLTDRAGLGLKWPNDVLSGDRKLNGILVEVRSADTVLVGIGTNLRDPGHPGAAWLTGDDGLLAQEPQDDALAPRLAGLLAAAIVRRIRQLEAADGDADAAGLRDAYRMSCVTLDRDVRIEPLGQPDGSGPHGRAVGIDADGRLLVQEPDGRTTAVGAGDVVHATLDPSNPIAGELP